ncbi:hypothetical protein HUJ04_002242 [Dendroctonus ponderosae]|nr:hypothetical protein HUJ04_002242 [Dendroctonus ponderosae]
MPHYGTFAVDSIVQPIALKLISITIVPVTNAVPLVIHPIAFVPIISLIQQPTLAWIPKAKPSTIFLLKTLTVSLGQPPLAFVQNRRRFNVQRPITMEKPHGKFTFVHAQTPWCINKFSYLVNGAIVPVKGSFALHQVAIQLTFVDVSVEEHHPPVASAVEVATWIGSVSHELADEGWITDRESALDSSDGLSFIGLLSTTKGSKNESKNLSVMLFRVSLFTSASVDSSVIVETRRLFESLAALGDTDPLPFNERLPESNEGCLSEERKFSMIDKIGIRFPQSNRRINYV